MTADNWDLFEVTTRLDNKLLTVMDREAKYYYESGRYRPNMPNMREHIETTYLKQTSIDKVTIN
jgi:hypothetical protein